MLALKLLGCVSILSTRTFPFPVGPKSCLFSLEFFHVLWSHFLPLDLRLCHHYPYEDLRYQTNVLLDILGRKGLSIGDWLLSKRQRLEGEAKLIVWRPLLEPWGSWSVDDWTQEPLLEHRLRDAGLPPSLLLWLPLQERCLGGKATRMHFWRKFSQIHSSISCHWQWRTTRDMKTDSLFMPVFPSEYKAIYSILQNPGRREVLVNGWQLITGWTVLEKTPMVSIPVPACLPNIFPLPCLLKLYFLISRRSS